MSDDSARSVVAPGRRKRRWVRALALGAAALLVVLVVAVGAVAWVLTHLDHPAVKARWVEAVRNATGLEIDVDSASISLSGRVTLAGLRVAQPPRQRPFAPDFAVVEAFEATADVPALLTGRIRIDPIAIRGVSVTVVVDASGRTSLDDVLAGLAPTRPAPLPPTPRSRMMEVEGLDLVVSSFTVRDVHFAQIVTRNAAIATIRTLQGLDLDAAVRIAGGRLDATMTLASPADGTLLDVRPSNTGDAEASQSGARAGLRMSASVKESREARLTLEADLLDQSFDTRLQKEALGLRAEASATFDPAAGEIRLRLDRLDVAGGALAASGRATLPDDPRDGVIAVIEEATVVARTDPIAQILQSLLPRLKAVGGTLSADVSGLALLDRAPGVAFRGPVSIRAGLASGSFEQAGLKADGSGIEGSLEARVGPDGVVSSDLRLAARGLVAESGTSRVEGTGLIVEVGVGDLALADAVHGKPVGSARLAIAATSLEARTAQASVALALRPPAVLEARRGADGHVWARLDLPVERLSARLSDGRGVGPLGPSRLTASTEGMGIAGDGPWNWTGAATAQAVLPGMRLDASARKPGDVVSWDLGLHGALPGAFVGLLPASARRMLEGPGPGVALVASGLASRGDGRGMPSISATASGELTRLGIRAGGHRLDVPAIRLRLGLAADRPEPELTADVTMERSRLDGRPLADRVVLAATSRGIAGGRSARVTMTADAGGPTTSPILDAHLDTDWRRAARSIGWTARGTLRRTAGLRDALPAEMASRLAGIECDEVSLDGSGLLDGLSSGPSGLPAMPPDLVRSLRGNAALGILLKGLRVKSGEIRVDAPEVKVTSRVDAREAEVEATLVLSQPALAVKAGTRSFAASAIAAEARVRLPRDQGFRQAAVSLTASVAEASQDVWAPYPVKGLTLSVRGAVSPGALRLDKVVLDHPGGGTRLEFTADAEASPGGGGTGEAQAGLHARSLRIEGLLDQDLGAVRGAPETFRGTGRIRVPFRVESGNGNRLNLLASVESTDVSMDVPGAGFSLVGARGRMPVSEELQILPDGSLTVVQGPGGSPWSRVRFHDLNPYLKGGWFATDRVTLGRIAAGPLAGNLRLDRTVLALDQMQATWRGGTVTGQLVVERGSDDTRAWFKGDVTGVEPGPDGEGLDANVALRVSMRHQDVDGRVQLIRLGRNQLRSLLDLWDPMMENVSANRIRKVLFVGYPRSARIRMDGGFLSARVELGGIASVVRIDEIRGIPVGPLVRRFLGGVFAVHGGSP